MGLKGKAGGVTARGRPRKSGGGKRTAEKISEDKPTESKSSHTESFTSSGPEVPLSPVPSTLVQPLSPPGTFGSPPPLLTFPSPPPTRTSPDETPGGVVPPSEQNEGEEHGQPTDELAFPGMSPSYQQQQQLSSSRTQLHLPQRSSHVQQQRHPDGSMTISIGVGGEREGFGDHPPPIEGVPPSPDISATAANLSDMSQLLFYGSNNSDQGDDQNGESESPQQGRAEEQDE